ncbi:hypothetical protein Q5H91_11110 [Sphingomonas sp. KR1UV-12]|uniref:Uncharacterized protein n=1 Tax=Sphingomonas aurea TaxID=3063994 RepID=A0ABT9ELC0_9SPHN|nr:hypothetical protein [Sphingomonas sp. KR1UV-12]MDP1027765.1 hypothetical protein [Sphingomonas sp. KR1UV-12]
MTFRKERFGWKRLLRSSLSKLGLNSNVKPGSTMPRQDNAFDVERYGIRGRRWGSSRALSHHETLEAMSAIVPSP